MTLIERIEYVRDFIKALKPTNRDEKLLIKFHLTALEESCGLVQEAMTARIALPNLHRGIDRLENEAIDLRKQLSQRNDRLMAIENSYAAYLAKQYEKEILEDLKQPGGRIDAIKNLRTRANADLKVAKMATELLQPMQYMSPQ